MQISIKRRLKIHATFVPLKNSLFKKRLIIKLSAACNKFCISLKFCLQNTYVKVYLQFIFLYFVWLIQQHIFALTKIWIYAMHYVCMYVCMYVYVCKYMKITVFEDTAPYFLAENHQIFWGTTWKSEISSEMKVDYVRNVMAHAQKPDFVLRRNGRVHLNRRGRQFSRLLAAEVCA